MASNRIIYSAYIPLEIELLADFYLLDSWVRTESRPVPQPFDPEATDLQKGDQPDPEERDYLVISITTELESWESGADSAAHARPRFLIILGVLTYFCEYPFTPFQTTEGRYEPGAIQSGDRMQLSTGDFDFSEDLRILGDYIEQAERSERHLVFSLLDRWRKAVYVEEENADSFLYDDELVLLYFHILELLSTEYYPDLKSETISKINDFLGDLLGGTFQLEDNLLVSESADKSKLIKADLLTHVPVANKILFMLNKLGLQNSRVKEFIFDLIKDRNKVAHGRQAYEEKVLFPLTPFFSIIKDPKYPTAVLKYLSARVIATHIGLAIYDDEWIEARSMLYPTKAELRDFRELKFHEQLSFEEFCAGDYNEIDPGVISQALVEGRIKANEAMDILERVILQLTSEEETIASSIMGIALIADVAKGELKEKCKALLIKAKEEHWLPFLDMREMLKYLWGRNHKPKVLNEMIESKEIR